MQTELDGNNLFIQTEQRNFSRRVRCDFLYVTGPDIHVFQIFKKVWN